MSVSVAPNYVLHLQFENGEKRILDIASYMGKRPFVALKSPAPFGQARVECGTVVWPGSPVQGCNQIRLRPHLSASSIEPQRPRPGGALRTGVETRLSQPFTETAMESVNIYDAKTRLSQLVDRAASGEDVVVSRNGKPLVRITRLDNPKQKITFGVLKGKVTIAADFDAPLPADVVAGFEGR